jgi:isocitrate/isopropylmalate dehydrogenase
VIFIRETIEDLYIGVEHELDPIAAVSLEVTPRVECEADMQVVLLAAPSARLHRVTGISKSSIFELRDGNFDHISDEAAALAKVIKSDRMLTNAVA